MQVRCPSHSILFLPGNKLTSAAGATKPTRLQRGAEAAKEILATRGVNARSLASPKPPPQTFTITRQRIDRPPQRGNFTPRAGNQTQRGGFRGRSRGGSQLGLVSRGRGRGRGSRATIGRARGGRGKGKRAARPNTEEDEQEPDPFTEEELTWMAGDAGGWPTPYEPKTSLEQLLGKGLTVMGSASGTLEAAMTKVQLGTDNVNGPHKHSDEHLVRMKEGEGTFFESAEAKTVTQKYLNDQRKLRADRLKMDFTLMEISMLPEAEREKLSRAWIAGQYVKPEPASPGDILAQAETYAKLNETYLSEDARKLQAKIASLLPSIAQKPAATQPHMKPV